MASLAQALPAREDFKALRGMPNVIVEPQIAMLTASIDRAIQAGCGGDVLEMLRAYEDLNGWTG